MHKLKGNSLIFNVPGGCPAAAGIAALLKQADPGLKPTQMKKILESTGEKHICNDVTYVDINPQKALEKVLQKKEDRDWKKAWNHYKKNMCLRKSAEPEANIASFSSREPTIDKLVKPDLIPPGTPIAPEVNGQPKSINLRKVWENGWTGKGVTIADIGGNSLTRSILLNTNDPSEIKRRTITFDDNGQGTHEEKGPSLDFQDLIKGIKWAIQNKDRYNIRLARINSIDKNTLNNENSKKLQDAIVAAAKAGLVVVVPENAGIYKVTKTPMTVTVGA